MLPFYSLSRKEKPMEPAFRSANETMKLSTILAATLTDETDAVTGNNTTIYLEIAQLQDISRGLIRVSGREVLRCGFL
jgi:hypothetical protein